MQCHITRENVGNAACRVSEKGLSNPTGFAGEFETVWEEREISGGDDGEGDDDCAI